MTTDEHKTALIEEFRRSVGAVSKEMEADVLFYVGKIEKPASTALVTECCEREGALPNVLLVLETLGGDPDEAYRIARCLQNHYDRFSIFIPSLCKSAGTLIAIGAHEIVISDLGELGPLDMQLSIRDELFESQSGLISVQALARLRHEALATFEDYFLSIKSKGVQSITLKTATNIATQLTSNLYSKLFEQIDPMRVGEEGMALDVASFYGQRLLSKSENIEPDTLKWIVTGYPSHSFVIDREEAKELFRKRGATYIFSNLHS